MFFESYGAHLHNFRIDKYFIMSIHGNLLYNLPGIANSWQDLAVTQLPDILVNAFLDLSCCHGHRHIHNLGRRWRVRALVDDRGWVKVDPSWHTDEPSRHTDEPSWLAADLAGWVHDPGFRLGQVNDPDAAVVDVVGSVVCWDLITVRHWLAFLLQSDGPHCTPTNTICKTCKQYTCNENNKFLYFA